MGVSGQLGWKEAAAWGVETSWRAGATVQARGKTGEQVNINWHKLCALIQVSRQPRELGYYVYPYFIEEEPETQGG